MKKAVRKSSTIILTFIIALFLYTGSAHAFNGILNAFNSRYPGSSSGTNASCRLCHGGSSNSTWNEYGWGLRQNGQNFSALESLSSVNIDGGTTNLDEINASTQPGWTTGANDLYNSNGLLQSTYTAPAGIGDLDPPAANQPPVANDDSATTDQSVAITIDVLANDTDADNDTLTVDSVTQPVNGSVTITNNGNDVTYTPASGFFGTDTFTYIAFDGTDVSDSAMVTVTVNEVGETPVDIDDEVDYQYKRKRPQVDDDDDFKAHDEHKRKRHEVNDGDDDDYRDKPKYRRSKRDDRD